MPIIVDYLILDCIIVGTLKTEMYFWTIKQVVIMLMFQVDVGHSPRLRHIRTEQVLLDTCLL